MKLMPLFLLGLVVVGLALGCVSQPEQESGDLSPETESEVFNDIESTLIDEDSTVEIGEML